MLRRDSPAGNKDTRPRTPMPERAQVQMQQQQAPPAVGVSPARMAACAAAEAEAASAAPAVAPVPAPVPAPAPPAMSPAPPPAAVSRTSLAAVHVVDRVGRSVTLARGSFAYFAAAPLPGQLPSPGAGTRTIGEVAGLRARGDSVDAVVRWFAPPAQLGARRKHHGDRELVGVADAAVKSVPVSAFVELAAVAHFGGNSEYSCPGELMHAEGAAFFWRETYSLAGRRFLDDAKKICYCNSPVFQDIPPAPCTKCDKLFHLTCIDGDPHCYVCKKCAKRNVQDKTKARQFHDFGAEAEAALAIALGQQPPEHATRAAAAAAELSMIAAAEAAAGGAIVRQHKAKKRKNPAQDTAVVLDETALPQEKQSGTYAFAETLSRFCALIAPPPMPQPAISTTVSTTCPTKIPITKTTATTQDHPEPAFGKPLQYTQLVAALSHVARSAGFVCMQGSDTHALFHSSNMALTVFIDRDPASAGELCLLVFNWATSQLEYLVTGHADGDTRLTLAITKLLTLMVHALPGAHSPQLAAHLDGAETTIRYTSSGRSITTRIARAAPPAYTRFRARKRCAAACFADAAVAGWAGAYAVFCAAACAMRQLCMSPGIAAELLDPARFAELCGAIGALAASSQSGADGEAAKSAQAMTCEVVFSHE